MLDLECHSPNGDYWQGMPIQGRPSLNDFDRLGIEFCEAPKALNKIRDVQRYRKFRLLCLATTLRITEEAEIPTNALVSIRLKRLDSIRQKLMRPEANFKLGRMDDIIGIRIICQDLKSMIDFSKRVENLNPYFVKSKNYLTSQHPNATGYRGIHHIMTFKQKVDINNSVNVRFEMQIRTPLQHRWAIFSESLGQAAKIGNVSDEDRKRLMKFSNLIAQSEKAHLDKMQERLPNYSGGKNLIVVWRTEDGKPMPYRFQNDVNGAVNWLIRREEMYPSQRRNALLLVGASGTDDEVETVLRKTHPTYFLRQPIDLESLVLSENQFFPADKEV